MPEEQTAMDLVLEIVKPALDAMKNVVQSGRPLTQTEPFAWQPGKNDRTTLANNYRLIMVKAADIPAVEEFLEKRRQNQR